MKNYYELFVDLCLQQCTKNDYKYASRVRKHNAAYTKIGKLKAEMKEIDCTEILNRLLSHEDDRVRLNAASLCLQMNVLVDKALLTLKNIVDFSKDSMLSFSAEMVLKNMVK